MTAFANTPRIPLDTLRDRIAEAIAAHVKAYNLPSVGERLGLGSGKSDEANRSKRLYVKARILNMDETELLKLARGVVTEFGDERLSDMLSEMTTPAHHRVSDITRRDTLKALNSLDSLFGDTDLFEGLSVVASEPISQGEDVFGLPTLAGRIRQHYLRNEDWSHEQLLIECGVLSCAQSRFFRLIERLLDPVVRRGDEQMRLADTLNEILSADDFRVVITGEKSRHPLYAIERISSNVGGKPKNLVFAAINTKPDLYFIDAINNDIAIRNATDALIYDEFLYESGLRWETLTHWWQTHEHFANLGEATSALYRRLLRSVKATDSPGQFALFDSYYREFPSRMKDKLPALIPEVYLHYDPRTLRERGADPVLLRQRMDFLVLLDHNVRIVLEVDGSQHYSEAGRAAPAKYAEMAGEDRRLRLAGYELYRFGAAEFSDTTSFEGKITVGPRSRQVVMEFFNRLWLKYGIKA